MSNDYLTAEEIGAMCCPKLSAVTVRSLAQKRFWHSQKCTSAGGRPKLKYLIRDALDTLGDKLARPLAEQASRPQEPPANPDVEKQLSPAGCEANPTVTPTEPHAAPPIRPEDVSDEARKRAGKKMAILDALEAYLADRKGERPQIQLVEEFAELQNSTNELKVSRSTLLEWRTKRRKHGFAGLLDGRSDSSAAQGKRKEIPTDIWTNFKRGFLRPQQPSVATVRRHVLLQYPKEIRDRLEKAYPTHLFCRRIITDIPKAIVTLAREGERVYAQKHELILQRDYGSIQSNDIWNADHHPMDEWVWDPITRKAYRPWLTIFQDVRSRLITGWTLELSAPDQYRVMVTFANSVMVYGLPAALMLDNGKDFRSQRFSGGRRTRFKVIKDEDKVVSILSSLNVEPHFVKPYLARAKPAERVFGFMEADFGKLQESYWGNVPLADRRPETAKELVQERPWELPTIEAFREDMAKFWDWYNNAWPHSGDGMDGRTPQQVYDAHLHRQLIRPVQDELRLLLLPSELVTVRRACVQITITGGAKVRYKSEKLMALEGHPVRVHYNAQQLGKAYLFDTEGRDLHHEVELFDKVPFDTSTDQYKAAIAEQKRLTRAVKQGLQAQLEQAQEPTVQDTLARLQEEADAAKESARELRKTGTDGPHTRARKRSKPPAPAKPRLRVFSEHSGASALKERADQLEKFLNKEAESSGPTDWRDTIHDDPPPEPDPKDEVPDWRDAVNDQPRPETPNDDVPDWRDSI